MRNNCTVYVFGGAGFIGIHLLNYLSDCGSFGRIVCVDIKPRPAEFFEDRVSYYEVDATLALKLEPGKQGDLIINLIGLRTFPGFPDKEYFSTNVESTRSIIEFSRQSNICDMIFTSTMAVYPMGNIPKIESSNVCPESAYGHSKLQAESLLREWLSEDVERKLVVCRPAVIFGLGDNGNFTRLTRVLRRGLFVYAGRNDTIKSSGYVKDLVVSFFFAFNRAKKGQAIVYNFAFPDQTTIKQITESLVEIGGFSKPRLVVPARLLKIFALFFEGLEKLGIKNDVSRARIEKLYRDTNIVPQWLVDNGFHWSFDLDESLNDWYKDCKRIDFY